MVTRSNAEFVGAKRVKGPPAPAWNRDCPHCLVLFTFPASIFVNKVLPPDLGKALWAPVPALGQKILARSEGMPSSTTYVLAINQALILSMSLKYPWIRHNVAPAPMPPSSEWPKRSKRKSNENLKTMGHQLLTLHDFARSLSLLLGPPYLPFGAMQIRKLFGAP